MSNRSKAHARLAPIDLPEIGIQMSNQFWKMKFMPKDIRNYCSASRHREQMPVSFMPTANIRPTLPGLPDLNHGLKKRC